MLSTQLLHVSLSPTQPRLQFPFTLYLPHSAKEEAAAPQMEAPGAARALSDSQTDLLERII